MTVHKPFAAALGLVALIATSAVAQAAGSPRHLVYNFSLGVQSSNVSQTSALQENSMSQSGGVIGGYGLSSMDAGVNDKGQITVDVQGVEPDGGLVVTVAETDQSNRSARSNTCVVYATTNVVCGTGQTNPEEYAVLRTLSPAFFDASALDANRHWRVAPAAGVTIDFTANPASDGKSVGITAERVESAANGSSVKAEAKYEYDVTRLLPVKLSDYQTVRQQGGAGKYADVIVDITATLVSDSTVATH